MTIAGISGVITKKDLRQRKLASSVLRLVEKYTFDTLKLNHILLLCHSKNREFYKKLEYKEVKENTFYTQSSGKSSYPHHTMVKSFGDVLWRSGRIDLNGLPW